LTGLHKSVRSAAAQPEAKVAGLAVEGEFMTNLHLTIGPLVALIAGILILIVPRLLNYIVAIYLIIIGLLGLFGGNIRL
jgi:hypothetical protein